LTEDKPTFRRPIAATRSISIAKMVKMTLRTSTERQLATWCQFRTDGASSSRPKSTKASRTSWAPVSSPMCSLTIRIAMGPVSGALSNEAYALRFPYALGSVPTSARTKATVSMTPELLAVPQAETASDREGPTSEQQPRSSASKGGSGARAAVPLLAARRGDGSGRRGD
jgi:hypothetical protein